MNRLDRYVFRIVVGAFGTGLLFFLFLSIVMDLLGNLSRYVDRAARNGMGGTELALYLAAYYGKLLPVLFTTITPFVTVIAGMFAVARLQGANEVVPMLFTGRSTQRVLRPMLLCGVMAGLAMAGTWQWVVPKLGAAIAEADSFLNQGAAKQANLVVESGESPRHHLYVREYDPGARTMLKVAMLSTGAIEADSVLVTAERARWDDARRDWQLETGKRRSPRGSQDEDFLGRPDLTPATLLQRGREQVDPDLQSYTELVAVIAERPNRPDLKLALHRHVTYPIANLILLLLALPLAIHFERRSRIERLLGAIGLCAAYLFVDLTCQSLGQRGFLHPIVAAWSPTIVFGALGAVLFGSART